MSDRAWCSPGSLAARRLRFRPEFIATVGLFLTELLCSFQDAVLALGSDLTLSFFRL